MTTEQAMRADQAMRAHNAIQDLQDAEEAMYDHLKALEGSEKRQAVRAALQAGITPTRLADGLGISRSRLYQLKEGKQS